MGKHQLDIRTGRSFSKDEKQAVREFHEAVYQPGSEAVVFFCSSRYDLDILGKELAERFECPLIGCTTAGEVSHFGYQSGGIVGVSLSSRQLKIHRHTICPLSRFTLEEAEKIAAAVRSGLTLTDNFDRAKMFGFLLIDGLSMLEEETIASFYTCFGDIPIVGGSAGDDLDYHKTFVYDDGRFISDAAVFTLFETTLPFRTFMIKHFQPTEKKIVITGADPKNRIITEINGEPAAVEYARVLGLELNQLDSGVYSQNPLMLRIGGEWYVRSVQRRNNDNSLRLFSAIEEGLVLTIGKGVDIVRNFREQLDLLEKQIPSNRFFLLCDCILRKLELSENGIIGEFNSLLAGTDAVGFSTYGEQFNSIHVNQTLTGVVIGG